MDENYKHENVQQVFENLRLAYPNLPIQLREEQTKSIHSVYFGKDLICILPTGYGKTLCIILPSLFVYHIQKRASTTVIISPLVSIIQSMTLVMKSYGITPYYVTAQESLPGFADYPVFILCSPEMFRRRFMKNCLMEQQVDLIAVDEGHMVSEWGNKFRQDYAAIHEIRSFVKAPMAVFTATVSSKILTDVIERVGILEENCESIAVISNRKNIFIDVRNSNPKLEDLDWLVTEMQANIENVPKTIIFAPSAKKVTNIFNYFHSSLGVARKMIGNKVIGLYVEMYTKSTDPASKEHITNEFMKPGSYIRVLIATIAFGMGVDIPDIRQVIIWGLPKSPMLLWQEIGRVGRDSMKATAIIHPTMDKTSKWNLLRDNCYRKGILNEFYSTEKFEEMLHNINTSTANCPACNCCNYCSRFHFVTNPGNSNIIAQFMILPPQNQNQVTLAIQRPELNRMQKIFKILAPRQLLL